MIINRETGKKYAVIGLTKLLTTHLYSMDFLCALCLFEQSIENDKLIYAREPSGQVRNERSFLSVLYHILHWRSSSDTGLVKYVEAQQGILSVKQQYRFK